MIKNGGGGGGGGDVGMCFLMYVMHLGHLLCTKDYRAKCIIVGYSSGSLR